MTFAYDKPEYMTLFIPYKLTILGPTKMYLKSVSMVNTETYIVIISRRLSHTLVIKQQNKSASIIPCQLCFAKLILLTAQNNLHRYCQKLS